MINESTWASVHERMRPTFLCRVITQDGTSCAEMVSPVNIPVESPRVVYELEQQEPAQYFGRITYWSFTYGFIRLKDGTQVYIHQSDCADTLFVGALMRFDLEHTTEHDKFRAVNCTLVSMLPPDIYVIGDTPVIPTLGNSLHDLKSMGCSLPLGTIGSDCIRPFGRYIFVRKSIKSPVPPTPVSTSHDTTASECAMTSSEIDMEPGEIGSSVDDCDANRCESRFDRTRQRDVSSDED